MNKNLVKKGSLIIITCFLAISWSQAQLSTFKITATGTTSQIDKAIEHATSIWGSYLVSDVPIKIKINYMSLTQFGPLAITFPNARKNFPQAPVADTWYPTCLVNAINKTDLNPTETDMDIFVNSEKAFYFGLDGNPSAGEFDFVTILLHEIGHGLGFTSLAKVASSKGSFGEITSQDFFPLGPSFPFPKLEGKPSIFDLHLKNGSTQELTDQTIFPNNTISLADELTGDDAHFTGNFGAQANGNSEVKIHAPFNFVLGTSITHLDENTFNGTENSLMSPFFNYGEVQHVPGPVILGVFKDIGWEVGEPAAIHQQGSDYNPDIVAFPMPFEQHVTLSYNLLTNSAVKLEITDMQGRLLDTRTFSKQNTGKHQITWNGSNLKPGIYLYYLSIDDRRFSGKLCKAAQN